MTGGDRMPCECGAIDATWHGPECGLREYCCDACWASRAFDKLETVQANASRVRRLIDSLESEKP